MIVLLLAACSLAAVAAAGPALKTANDNLVFVLPGGKVGLVGVVC